MSKFIYGLHDYSPVWANQVRAVGKTAWVVETLEIDDEPTNTEGGNFSDRAGYGLTVIGRLNYSHHGAGTIPMPSRYDAFAQRCANYVSHSQGCTTWIIGNEPNHRSEWPFSGRARVKINPVDYALCYTKCLRQIKNVSTSHQVLLAPMAPYTDDAGWYIDYFIQVLQSLQSLWVTPDGFCIHTYSRGSEPNSVHSETKMDAPYDAYYNGFRAYRDILAVIPQGWRTLPVYITETDQLEPWADKNSGWVKEAYTEIDDWNHSSGQKISCLALYRWPHYDQWFIEGKQGVITDFRQTLQTTNFLVPEKEKPLPDTGVPTATVTVTAPAGANIRSGPSIDYPTITAMPFGSIMAATGKGGVGADVWWQVKEPAGWVSNAVVKADGIKMLPTITAPAPVTAPTSYAWLINALSRVVGIDPKVAQAILAIESGGSGFGPDGRLTIRLEAHLFLDNVSTLASDKLPQAQAHFRHGNPSWTNQEWNPDNGWQPLHDQGQIEEYAAFTLARGIDEFCAYASISMGSSQIIGSNARSLGYLSPQAMYAAFSDKEIGSEEQIVAMFAYLRSRGLLIAAANKDWLALARGYNGTGAAMSYASQLRQKYLELGGTN